MKVLFLLHQVLKHAFDALAYLDENGVADHGREAEESQIC